MRKYRFYIQSAEGKRLRLTLNSPAGLDGYMCRDVACCHDRNGEASYQRQDVFRTVFGHRPVLEKG